MIDHPRILITGSTGLIGKGLITSHTDVDLFTTSRSHDALSPAHFPVDLADHVTLFNLLEDIDPHVVIHTAAITSVDAAEDDHALTDRINVAATKVIVDWVKVKKRRLVFFSTDFVFDGASGPNSEDDQPNPLSYYASSKWKAEQIIQAAHIDHAIIRPVLVFGYFQDLVRPNFPLWLIQRLSEGIKTQITADQWRNPTYAEDLLHATWQLAKGNQQGVFHLGGAEYLSMYDFALSIAEIFSLDISLLSAITTNEMNQIGRRPLQGGLSINKARTSLGFNPRSMDQALISLKRKMGT